MMDEKSSDFNKRMYKFILEHYPNAREGVVYEEIESVMALWGEFLQDEIAEAYKKGRIDGSIEVINGTCEICHAYPMTVDCNNAGCDK